LIEIIGIGHAGFASSSRSHLPSSCLTC